MAGLAHSRTAGLHRRGCRLGVGRSSSLAARAVTGVHCRGSTHGRLAAHQSKSGSGVQRPAAARVAQCQVAAVAAVHRRNPRGGDQSTDRGRKRLSPSPPSEPGVRVSRDGLSSRLFPHRDWRADRWASDIVNSPRLAKKAFGHLPFASFNPPFLRAANIACVQIGAGANFRCAKVRGHKSTGSGLNGTYLSDKRMN